MQKNVNNDQKNKCLFLIRHGQTALNAAGIIQGHIEEPLNETGEKQAYLSAKYFLKYIEKNNIAFPEKFVASTILRARQTANIYAEVLGFDKNKIIQDFRITERRFGPIERTASLKVKEEMPNSFDVLTLGKITDEAEYERIKSEGGDVCCGIESRTSLQKRLSEAIKEHYLDIEPDKDSADFVYDSDGNAIGEQSSKARMSENSARINLVAEKDPKETVLMFSHGAAIAAVSRTLVTDTYGEVANLNCMGNCHFAVYSAFQTFSGTVWRLHAYDAGDFNYKVA